MSIDPVDLRTLTTLVAVADEGSFRGAAQALGYTQSAISHHIAVLERRLGIKVFERPGGRRRIALTPHGEIAYQHAQRVLAAADTLDASLTAYLCSRPLSSLIV